MHLTVAHISPIVALVAGILILTIRARPVSLETRRGQPAGIHPELRRFAIGVRIG